MAISAELADLKSNCWGTPWRVTHYDLETGMPRGYIRLSHTELAQFVALGQASIPDRELPAEAIRQRDMAKALGVPNLREVVRRGKAVLSRAR